MHIEFMFLFELMRARICRPSTLHTAWVFAPAEASCRSCGCATVLWLISSTQRSMVLSGVWCFVCCQVFGFYFGFRFESWIGIRFQSCFKRDGKQRRSNSLHACRHLKLCCCFCLSEGICLAVRLGRKRRHRQPKNGADYRFRLRGPWQSR